MAMLASTEYGTIKEDYHRISSVHFPQSYVQPDGMSFAASPALFPDADLSAALGAEYEAQCAQLCFGPYPSWREVEARFRELKALL